MRSPKHLNIDITATDIASGMKNNCNRCPIALALKRRLKSAGAYVDFEVAYATDADGNQISRTYTTNTKDLEDFMNAFDEGNGVKPFRPCLGAA